MSRLHFLRTQAQFDAARARWEEPPDDDGLTECPVCDGVGHRMVLDDGNKPYRELRPCCDGHRLLDENGMPYDRAALARMAEGD